MEIGGGQGLFCIGRLRTRIDGWSRTGLVSEGDE